jgi:hypothetical protein
MKALTNGQRQWVWLAALWCAGLMGASALAYAARWLIAKV